MKINNFRGDLTDVSAVKEVLERTLRIYSGWICLGLTSGLMHDAVYLGSPQLTYQKGNTAGFVGVANRGGCLKKMWSGSVMKMYSSSMYTLIIHCVKPHGLQAATSTSEVVFKTKLIYFWIL